MAKKQLTDSEKVQIALNEITKILDDIERQQEFGVEKLLKRVTKDLKKLQTRLI
jgi:hypothetical protein